MKNNNDSNLCGGGKETSLIRFGARLDLQIPIPKLLCAGNSCGGLNILHGTQFRVSIFGVLDLLNRDRSRSDVLIKSVQHV
jgi:hypothetical protein